MEIDILKSWLGGFALVVSVLGTIYAWLTSRSNINAEHLKTVDILLAEHSEKIIALEHEFNHLPDKDAVTELKLSIAELKGTVGRLDEGMSGVSRTIRRVEDYLMKGTAK